MSLADWGILFAIVVGVLGIFGYVSGFISKVINALRKRREKKRSEQEKRKKKILDDKIEHWKSQRRILDGIKQPLRHFNQMGRFPDDYGPKSIRSVQSKYSTTMPPHAPGESSLKPGCSIATGMFSFCSLIVLTSFLICRNKSL